MNMSCPDFYVKPANWKLQNTDRLSRYFILSDVPCLGEALWKINDLKCILSNQKTNDSFNCMFLIENMHINHAELLRDPVYQWSYLTCNYQWLLILNVFFQWSAESAVSRDVSEGRHRCRLTVHGQVGIYEIFGDMCNLTLVIMDHCFLTPLLHFLLAVLNSWHVTGCQSPTTTS